MGPASAPAQVTVPAANFPDPAVSDVEMGSYPAAPAVGQPATLWARVRNLGQQDATAVKVRLRLVDTAGTALCIRKCTARISSADPIVRNITSSANCERYLVITKYNGVVPGTKMEIKGIGAYSQGIGSFLGATR